jgi:hypothetical protein
MINNREDLNKYYKLINELVDEYIDKWKIRPSNLKRYLKYGSDRFNKFLLRNNLSEIKGVDIILKDIIDDRVSMEKDGIMKFEKYKIFESDDFNIKSLKECLYKGIDNADLKMEKSIADYFDTNLSDIDIINAEKHIFRIKIWNDITFVIIYSKEEFNIIKENVIEYLYEDLSSKKVNLVDDISIELDNIIDVEKYNNKIKNVINDDLLKNIISKLLGAYQFEKEFNDYYIWKFNN